MAFDLTHAIIHSFTKEANTSEVSEVVEKGTLLNIGLPAVVSLVDGVNRLIGKTGNNVSYGQFGNDMREGPFPTEFKEYVADTTDQQKFLGLSKTALHELVTQAAEESFSTGGHILVALYNNDSAPYLLVAMIKQRGGITLNADYVPTEITEIDLSKVHQAVRINLNRYNEVILEPEEQEDAEAEDESEVDKTYLCFLGQRKNSQASGYFVKALGCTKGIASSRATSNAIKAIEKYFSTEELRKYRTRARDSVVSYLQRKLATGENATIDEICNAAINCLPAEEQAATEGLKEFLNNEKNKVPAQFPVHASTLNKKIRIKADAGNWSIQFDQQILGTTPESVIFYNIESKTITISSLTEQLINAIESELHTRSVN